MFWNNLRSHQNVSVVPVDTLVKQYGRYYMRVGSTISLCWFHGFHSPNLKHADIYLANNVTRQSVNERAGLQKIMNTQYTYDIKIDPSLPCIATFKHTHAASQCLRCNFKSPSWHSRCSYTRTHVHTRARTLFYSYNHTVFLRRKSIFLQFVFPL